MKAERKREIGYDAAEMLSYRVHHLPVADVSPSGGWRLEAFYVKAGSRAQLLASMGGHKIPEGLYTGLFRGEGRGAENLWMSDTPPEVASMLPAIRRFEDESSCRRVLIGGLGLGVLVQAALAHDHVERVDVVEKEQEVIDLVAPHYPDERLNVHLGDAVSFLPGKNAKMQQWDFAYYDVWQAYSASNLMDMLQIDELLRGRVREWEHWGRETCERILRQQAENHDMEDLWERYQSAKNAIKTGS